MADGHRLAIRCIVPRDLQWARVGVKVGMCARVCVFVWYVWYPCAGAASQRLESARQSNTSGRVIRVSRTRCVSRSRIRVTCVRSMAVDIRPAIGYPSRVLSR